MRIWRLVCVAMVTLAGSAQADVWDVGADTDNNSGTDNELTHGSRQTHDLGALPGPLADEDWYRLYMPVHTSWEVLVDGTTGDICAGGGTGVTLQMYEADGVTEEYAGLGVSSFNCTRSINITNFDFHSNVGSHNFVKVKAVDCTTNCDANDQYTIRARETTLYVPRFNNSATQITVCILQNTDDQPAEAQFAFLDTAGTLLTLYPQFLQPHQTLVMNLTTINAIPSLVGKSGSIMIMNSARFGRMAGKCVAVEPATGFTFDTQMTTRPD